MLEQPPPEVVYVTEIAVMKTFPLFPLEDPASNEMELPDAETADPEETELPPEDKVPLSFVVKEIVTDLSVAPVAAEIVKVPLSFAYRRHVSSVE
ncbi:MAG: hypothetical protein IJS57_01040 [Paludibacteraceae bacterium]|nr:hypothetical protein [Paludibacteraceae bacterium]